jgi:hypothetical protein
VNTKSFCYDRSQFTYSIKVFEGFGKLFPKSFPRKKVFEEGFGEELFPKSSSPRKLPQRKKGDAKSVSRFFVRPLKL